MPDSNEPMVSNLPVSNKQLLDKLDSMDNTLKGTNAILMSIHATLKQIESPGVTIQKPAP